MELKSETDVEHLKEDLKSKLQKGLSEGEAW